MLPNGDKNQSQALLREHLSQADGRQTLSRSTGTRKYRQCSIQLAEGRGVILIFPLNSTLPGYPKPKTKAMQSHVRPKRSTSNLFRSLGYQMWWHIQVGASTTNSLLFSTPNADHLTTSQSCVNSSVLH